VILSFADVFNLAGLAIPGNVDMSPAVAINLPDFEMNDLLVSVMVKKFISKNF
jgi:hypothetical protein